MSCKEASLFVDAYVDGELDFVRSTDFEGDLETCAACRATGLKNCAPRSALIVGIQRQPGFFAALLRILRRKVSRSEGGGLTTWIADLWRRFCTNAISIRLTSSFGSRRIPILALKHLQSRATT